MINLIRLITSALQATLREHPAIYKDTSHDLTSLDLAMSDINAMAMTIKMSSVPVLL